MTFPAARKLAGATPEKEGSQTHQDAPDQLLIEIRQSRVWAASNHVIPNCRHRCCVSLGDQAGRSVAATLNQCPDQLDICRAASRELIGRNLRSRGRPALPKQPHYSFGLAAWGFACHASISSRLWTAGHQHDAALYRE
ncbi:hypothetical protein SDC9_162087 [bioreactor metagenome]|uniref:Uncharacterized protein n=1 Tax=bioreactor metagenome TaxID=1076179 RepID=A0A645FK36_9ZZZZ